MIKSFPLAWPEKWQRTSAGRRVNGRFTREKKPITIAQGVMRILAELDAMSISKEDVIVSTNVLTRLDGMPRSDQKAPDDPGVSVYWRTSARSETKCMAIDRYNSVADNLGAIAATLEAMRAIERHGGAEIIERTFRGFAALPARTGPAWWDVLQVRRDASMEVVEANFRRLARDRHPDTGGSHEAMAELTAARTEALAEIRS